MNVSLRQTQPRKMLQLSRLFPVLFLAISTSSSFGYNDLSEFLCLDKTKPVQVVYYEAGPRKELPSPRMQQFMHLAYSGECVSQINFSQSTSYFAGSGKANNLIAVFAGKFQFPSAGRWTLYTSSQDGSKLYIDDEVVIHNDYVHKKMKEKSGIIDVAETDLVKDFRLEYFKGDSGANGLILKWKGPGKSKSVVQTTDFFIPTEAGLVGLPAYSIITPNMLTTRYPTESRDSLPSSYDPLLCATDPNYEYMWPNQSCELNENQAVVVEGWVQFPQKGKYTITELSDDDAKVYLDDKLVLTVDGKVGFQDKGQFSVNISEAGTAKYLRIEFLELCLGSGLLLTWEGPGITKGSPIEFITSD